VDAAATAKAEYLIEKKRFDDRSADQVAAGAAASDATAAVSSQMSFSQLFRSICLSG
jgi:hypothetical protein